MNVRDMLLHGSISLTPSEERIVQVLLTDYPAAGLGTATSLAKRAGVSDPTVVRLAMKLGFEGFPALQRRLLA
ncbi:MAG: MurR/RpiR family transcriptional regulator, partial [Mesorhizobium sp.]